MVRVKKACGYNNFVSNNNDAFAAAVLKQTSSKLDECLENTKLFLSRISPRISMGTDPMTDFWFIRHFE